MVPPLREDHTNGVEKRQKCQSAGAEPDESAESAELGGVPSDSLIDPIGGEDKNNSKRLNASSQVTPNWVNEAIRSDTPPAVDTKHKASDAQLRKFGIEPADQPRPINAPAAALRRAGIHIEDS